MYFKVNTSDPYTKKTMDRHPLKMKSPYEISKLASFALLAGGKVTPFINSLVNIFNGIIGHAHEISEQRSIQYFVT